MKPAATGVNQQGLTLPLLRTALSKIILRTYVPCFEQKKVAKQVCDSFCSNLGRTPDRRPGSGNGISAGINKHDI